MKGPTFLEGVAVAFLCSFLGGALHAAVRWCFDGATALSLVIAAVAGIYVLYLLSRSRERVGRVTVSAFWVMTAAALWVFNPPLPLYVLAHCGLIWILRCLYFHTSLLSSLADLGLTGIGLGGALWSASQSGSLFLSLWCFFLLQALFVAIPDRFRLKREGGVPAESADDGFERAHRAAVTALQRLSSTP